MFLLEYLQTHAAVAVAAALVFGLLIGSFLNVVIYRLPLMMEREWREECRAMAAADGVGDSAKAGDPAAADERFNLVVPRSRCPGCGAGIRAHQNVPVLSYVIQRGRCGACGWHIPLRYPIVELLTGLLAAMVVAELGVTLAAAGALALTFALVALAFIDLDTQYLPDSITLPLLWGGLLMNLGDVYVTLDQAVVGAMAGYLSLWLVYHGFRLLTGKEGMGHGDFKLMGALGAWMGWSVIPGLVLLSSVVGAVVGVGMILLRGHDRQVPIPFGPYIAAAGWICILWGDAVRGLYTGGPF
jgi:leader peptidase (prepilin peptidase)/N-methyltransferase